MSYQVRTILVHDDPTAVSAVDSRIIEETPSLSDAMSAARIERARLAAAPEDGVRAVVEVVEWDSSAVVWRETVGEDDGREDERVI